MNIPNEIMNINTPPQFDMQYYNLFNLLNRMNERINELIEKHSKDGTLLYEIIKEEFPYLDNEFIVKKIHNFFIEKEKKKEEEKESNKEFDGGKSKKKLNKKSKKRTNKKSKKRSKRK